MNENRPPAVANALRQYDEQGYRGDDATMAAFPVIVCLCGSTRFGEAFREANLRETVAGRIVLSIGCDMRSDADVFGHLTEAELLEMKVMLDWLHRRKLDLADEVLILNVGGYIGTSTRGELEYARSLGKRVRYLEPVDGEAR